MTSPKADLSTRKKQDFNHPRLAPQFPPRFPDGADTSTRLGAVVERSVGFFRWANHLDSVYFSPRAFPAEPWNTTRAICRNSPTPGATCLSRITLIVPGEAADDPARGPASRRHKPWTSGRTSPARFDWVELDKSLQWKAFQP